MRTSSHIRKLSRLVIISLSISLLSSQVRADKLIHYNEKGQAVGQYQCNKVSAHNSTHQDTLVCSRKARAVVSDLSMSVIRSSEEAQQCRNDRSCVVIDNPRDPHWVAIALKGIPDAVFGPNINGVSCAVIRESRPADSSWASNVWRLCTDNPNVAIAYTYALGHSNENIDQRFKGKDAKRICFNEALRGYQYQKYWKDNCVFVRPAGRPVINFR